MGRQTARTALLTGSSITAVGVDAFADLAAAGCLIDALDAHMGADSAILVNVAPRNGGAKKWSNGTPFGFFKYFETLVIATVDGYTLSLVKKFGLTERINLLDIGAVVNKMQREHLLTQEQGDFIEASQFRSYDFLPRVASYLLHENEVPSTRVSLEDLNVPDAPHAVWWVDNFGNAKTTMLPDEVGFEPGKRATLTLGEFMCYEGLSQIPDNEAGLVVGSSGLGEQRFLEIAVQGGRADEHINIAIGDELLESELSPEVPEETE